jgi:hypothetical protein
MPASSDKVLQLRQLLADHFGKPPSRPEECYISGLPLLDDLGIPRGALTEIVNSSKAPGGSLLFYGLLHAAAGRNERVMVIDGKDAFQPKELPQSNLERLLWTRCQSGREVLQVADLAARDGNFPLLLIQLTLNPAADLTRVQSTAWHRLQMLAEKSAVTVLVFTAFPQVGCAQLRLSVGGAFPLRKLHHCRSELLPKLSLNVERRRIHRSENEAVCRSFCA